MIKLTNLLKEEVSKATQSINKRKPVGSMNKPDSIKDIIKMHIQTLNITILALLN